MFISDLVCRGPHFNRPVFLMPTFTSPLPVSICSNADWVLPFAPTARVCPPLLPMKVRENVCSQSFTLTSYLRALAFLLQLFGSVPCISSFQGRALDSVLTPLGISPFPSPCSTSSLLYHAGASLSPPVASLFSLSGNSSPFGTLKSGACFPIFRENRGFLSSHALRTPPSATLPCCPSSFSTHLVPESASGPIEGRALFSEFSFLIFPAIGFRAFFVALPVRFPPPPFPCVLP